MSDTIHIGTLGGPRVFPQLKAHLSALGSDTTILASVEHLADLGVIEPLPPESAHRATVRVPGSGQVFAIPDSELKVWETAAGTAAAYFANKGIAGVVLAGLFTALVTMWKKYAILPSAQGAVLLALKRREFGTPDALEFELRGTTNLKAAQIAECLEWLKSVRLANGKVVAMVAEEDGQWWAVDI